MEKQNELKEIELPTIAEIIKQDFNLDIGTVCNDLKLSENDLQYMSPETSLKLGNYFHVSPFYFWDIYLDLKRRNKKEDKQMVRRELIDRVALLDKIWDADTRCGYVQVVDVADIETATVITEKEIVELYLNKLKAEIKEHDIFLGYYSLERRLFTLIDNLLKE